MASKVFLIMYSWMVVFCVITQTACYKCYNDVCEAGHQYCVDERQRCYHCKDRPNPCDSGTMISDCKAYCMEVALLARVRLLEGVIKNQTEITLVESDEYIRFRQWAERNNSILTTEKEELSDKLNNVLENKIDLLASVTGWQVAFGVSSLFLVAISIIGLCVLTRRRKKNKCRFIEEHVETGLLDGQPTSGQDEEDDTQHYRNKGHNNMEKNKSEKRKSEDSGRGSTSCVNDTHADENGADDTPKQPRLPHPVDNGSRNTDDKNSEKAAFVCGSPDNTFFAKLKS